jgi:hypothetical protein
MPFAITSHKGFHITFSNGVTVSVQFGPCNYCHEHRDNMDFGAPERVARWESTDAEVAIWDKYDKWITRAYRDDDDDVLAHISPDEVAEIIAWAASR